MPNDASGPLLLRALENSELWKIAEMDKVLSYLNSEKSVYSPSEFWDVFD